MQAAHTVQTRRWPSAAPRLGALTALTAIIALALASASAGAADLDVGVSIGINQPGVYGRIDIGRFPQPVVIVQRPVVVWVQQSVRPEPIYLRVPPGHRKNWRKHCAAYNACGTPVYFVQETWYQDHVVRGEPSQGGRRDDRRDDWKGDKKGDKKSDKKSDRKGDHGHSDNGRGRGNGHD